MREARNYYPHPPTPLQRGRIARLNREFLAAKIQD